MDRKVCWMPRDPLWWVSPTPSFFLSKLISTQYSWRYLGACSMDIYRAHSSMNRKRHVGHLARRRGGQSKSFQIISSLQANDRLFLSRPKVTLRLNVAHGKNIASKAVIISPKKRWNRRDRLGIDSCETLQLGVASGAWPFMYWRYLDLICRDAGVVYRHDDVRLNRKRPNVENVCKIEKSERLDRRSRSVVCGDVEV